MQICLLINLTAFSLLYNVSFILPQTSLQVDNNYKSILILTWAVLSTNLCLFQSNLCTDCKWRSIINLFHIYQLTGNLLNNTILIAYLLNLCSIIINVVLYWWSFSNEDLNRTISLAFGRPSILNEILKL